MAAEQGANEVSLAVLAITIVTVVVFFPVTLLFGVSKFLFTALALAVDDFVCLLLILSQSPLFLSIVHFFSAASCITSKAKTDQNNRGSNAVMRPSTSSLRECWAFMIAGCRRRSIGRG